jgi:micrococcal nuclease
METPMRTSLSVLAAFMALALVAGTSKAQADWSQDACRGPLPPVGVKFSGVVTWVGDGDMVCLGPNRDRRIEVRLADFNAPEKGQPNFQLAWDALRGIALDEFVECVGTHYSHDRIVARCTLDGRSLGDRMRDARAPEGGN